MNSGALVKVDTRESWMERTLGARGARLLLACGGTVAVTLSVPTTILEHVAATSGMGETVKFFAPPIGVGTRLALGCGLALIPAAIVWTLWGQGAVAAPDEAIEQEDDESMMHAHKQQFSGGACWGALIRLVRGTGPEGETDATLSRRRRDRHPDAPPRPPLFASRDLPAPDSVVSVDEDGADDSALANVEFAHFVQSGPVDASGESLVTLPRSPVPLSEEEIAEVVATIPPRQPRPVTASVHAPRELCSDLLRDLDLPLIGEADLAGLAARFERGVAKREVIAHASEAQQSLNSSIAFVQPDASVRAALRAQRSVESVSASQASFEPGRDTHASALSPRVDEDVEQALNSALATLRKLAEQGRR